MDFFEALEVFEVKVSRTSTSGVALPGCAITKKKKTAKCSFRGVYCFQLVWTHTLEMFAVNRIPTSGSL